MSDGTSFDSTKESLQEILKNIGHGKIQLPDFQRGWIWDDNHIKSLLASIAVSYPIGAVMLYETGNPEVRFKPRPVEGVEEIGNKKPEWLILDGQQRLTSLYQALMRTQPVSTRDSRRKRIERLYYILIPEALKQDADMEDAVISIPSDRIIRNFRNEVIHDYSSTELECQGEMFPVNLLFDTVELNNWMMKYIQIHPEDSMKRMERWNEFTTKIIYRFQQYQLPLIKMFKQTPKEAVCQVFEKVNTGGVSLNVFELLTATYAADEYNLRDDWEKRAKKLKKYAVLKTVQSDDFLQSISLLASGKKRKRFVESNTESDRAPAITCKRKDLLKLTLAEYQEWADKVTEGFLKAAKFMHSQRIFDARDLPYRTQLVPLATIFTHLGSASDSGGVKSKIAQWFWCGVFGELYGGATETRFAKDYPEVVDWINGGDKPATVKDAFFAPSRLYTLRTRNSAAYKGIYARLLVEGCKDFLSGDEITLQTYFDEKIDIHHIFPKKFCVDKGIDPKQYDCIVNKTAIAARTNKIIGGNPPKEYLEKIKKRGELTTQQIEDYLNSHAINPESLYNNNFDTFFKKREEALLGRIENAMGKIIQRDQQQAAENIDDYENIEEGEEEIILEE
ncbi:MAG: DUF262 domain-containing protein [Desulfobacteraceae bacterium]|nr:DUF262 domain-containing protein [Desulfobacteraceae bacterium]